MNRLFKVSFAPIIGTDDKNQEVKVGRYICYVTARDVSEIDGVLKAKIPEFCAGGFDFEEEIPVPPSSGAWSVSIGPVGRSYSVVVVAPDEAAARLALAESVKDLPYMKRYVDVDLFRAVAIDLDQENVW